MGVGFFPISRVKPTFLINQFQKYTRSEMLRRHGQALQNSFLTLGKSFEVGDQVRDVLRSRIPMDTSSDKLISQKLVYEAELSRTFLGTFCPWESGHLHLGRHVRDALRSCTPMFTPRQFLFFTWTCRKTSTTRWLRRLTCSPLVPTNVNTHKSKIIPN